MTRNEFDQALLGDPVRGRDGVRLRVKVADALAAYARRLRTDGQIKKAGQMTWLDSRIRVGLRPTKKVLRDLAGDLEAVAAEICDGNQDAVWD